MAGPVLRYFIEAKDNTAAGLKSATDGIKNFGAEAAKGALSTIAKFAGVTASIAGVGQVIKKSIEQAAEAEVAETKLALAYKNNPGLNGTAYKNAIQMAQGIANSTRLTKEQVFAQEALLASQGKNEGQIREIIKAATDYSAGSGKSFEESVQSLSDTYSGVTREMGKSSTAIANLTKQQLANGAAVRIVQEQYRGQGEAAGQTLQGQMESIKKSMNEIFENLGRGLAPVLKSLIQQIKPILDNIALWLAQHAQQISNFFLHLPQIVTLALEWIGKGFEHLFTAEHLIAVIKALGIFIFDVLKNTLILLWDFIKFLGSIIWEPLKTGFNIMIWGIKSLWHSFVAFLADAFNKTILVAINALLKGIQEAVNFVLDLVDKIRAAAFVTADAISHPLDAVKGKLESYASVLERLQKERGAGVQIAPMAALEVKPFTEKMPTLDKEAWTAQMQSALKDFGGQLKTTLGTAWEDVKKVAEETGKPFAEALKEYMPQFEKLLGKPIDVQLLSVPEGIDVNVKNADAVGKSVGSWIEQPLLAMASMIKSELFKVESKKDEATGKTTFSLAAMADPLTMVMQALGGFINSIASLSLLLNPLNTIFQAMAQVLEPVINELLAPLVGILVIVGQTIGALLIPVLKMLTPAIKILGQVFLFLYNYVIMPIVNFLMIIFNGVYNLIAGIWNFIANTLNSINIFGWHPFHIGTMQTRTWNEGFLTAIDETKLESVGTQTINNQGATGATGAAAQYTGQRAISITVTNTFEAWSVVGTPQQSFYDELKRNLGLIEALNTGTP